jgi:hypothetical protein
MSQQKIAGKLPSKTLLFVQPACPAHKQSVCCRDKQTLVILHPFAPTSIIFFDLNVCLMQKRGE